MRVRLSPRVNLRPDVFGGICYVPHRDDLFAANKDVFKALCRLKAEWTAVAKPWEPTYVALARLGICQTKPATAEIAYSGPSFLGRFDEIPTISEPLVVNCFSTAFCPLHCIYCHADDLMASVRLSESDEGPELDNVIATASMFPAMVAVITGGDPLTRPKRALRLVSRLAAQKALVMDTSGLGALDQLLPALKEHHVHVRVSLDAVGKTNDRLRPVNSKYFVGDEPSRYYAQKSIEQCLDGGLDVTVQTVVSTHNENVHELLQLRTLLLGIGVRHWVLHITVEGGSARRIEERVRKRGGRGIVPRGTKVYRDLSTFISDSKGEGAAIDIRCTDTNSTPNSVLLIDSKGDLYTEGYAHAGKVLLFDASSARPDLVRAKWMHIDRFGHAKRYLNWNRWLYEGKSLENICYEVPLPTVGTVEPAGTVVETEAKYPVKDRKGLQNILDRHSFALEKNVLQRDEYYDTADRSLGELDYVIRVRMEDGRVVFAFKGPRFYTKTLDYSRLEFQFSMSESVLRDELGRQGLVQTWYFEKRRTDFRKPQGRARISVDEIPEIGFFVEIEGPLDAVRELAGLLGSVLGDQERRNYRDLFVAHKEEHEYSRSEVKGASFENG